MRQRILIGVLILILLFPGLIFGRLPDAPSNLRITTYGCEGVVDLEWEDNSNNESGFIILRRPDEFRETSEEVGRVRANKTTFRDRVPDDRVWFYTVFSYNSDGRSSGFAQDGVVPKMWPPGDTTLRVLDSCDKVELHWGDSVHTEEGWRIEKRSYPSPRDTVIATIVNDRTTGSMTYTDTDVTVGETYSYRVIAFNECGGGSSDSSGWITIETRPEVPDNLSATVISCRRSVTLNWDDVAFETVYMIYRSTSAEGPWGSPLTRVGTDITTYTDSELDAGMTYYYKITARSDSCGTSEFSTVVSAVAHDRPAVPGNLTVTPQFTEGNIRLDWEDVANEEGYKIFRSTDRSRWRNIVDVAQDTTSYIDDVGTDTVYYYRIQAYNSCGRSSFSNEEDSALDEMRDIRKTMRDILIVPRQVLEKYLGDYEDERNPRIRLSVRMQGNTLIANSARFKPVTLTAKSNAEFFVKDKDISIKFNLNRAGVVQSVTLVMGGRSSTFKKK